MKHPPRLRPSLFLRPRSQPRHHLLRRPASNLASRTALSPLTPVPPSFAALHASLAALNALVPESTDQSRLSLIQRSLESPRPTLRFALLGAGNEGFESAKRLARVLLADPLGKEEEWEARILGLQGAGIVRASGSGNGLLEVVEVPSRVLATAGVEVLIAQVSEKERVEGCLVPVVQSPLAGSGRAGWVRFPVHRAVVVGKGLKGAVELVGLERESKEGLIEVVADVPVSGLDLDGVATTNVNEAEQALESFRRDVGTGPAFSHIWQASGVAKLSEGLFSDKGTRTGMDGLRPALKAQIRSLLSSTQASIDRTENTAEQALESQRVSESRRGELQSAITAWSEYAHTDLQNSLTYAFESRTWARTAFPRIVWRIDDVTFSGTEILYSNFLVETETYLAFLTGRIGEAGFFASRDTSATQSASSQSSQTPPSFTSSAPLTDEEAETQRRARFSPSVASVLRLDTLSARLRAETGIDTSVSKPWPRGIEGTRQTLLRTLLPALHARAQALVLQCLGTVGGTSALGIWYIVATGETGMFEAGAVAGLGLVWALRRLQRLWGEERTKFQGEVREQGRIVLGEIEALLRGIVREGKRPVVRQEDTQTWNEARRLIKAAEEELEKL